MRNMKNQKFRCPSGARLLGSGPLGLLDNVLHALRALRPCDPRNGAMSGQELGILVVGNLKLETFLQLSRAQGWFDEVADFDPRRVARYSGR